MTKQDLIDSLAGATELSRADAKKTVELFFQNMADALFHGERVEIRGLGSFSVKHYDGYIPKPARSLP